MSDIETLLMGMGYVPVSELRTSPATKMINLTSCIILVDSVSMMFQKRDFNINIIEALHNEYDMILKIICLLGYKEVNKGSKDMCIQVQCDGKAPLLISSQTKAYWFI